jgi:translation initiation factor IF-1
LAPNKNFKLEVDDIALIESALFEKLRNSKFDAERKTINELLGKLHDQKIWYRPSDGVYVSG